MHKGDIVIADHPDSTDSGLTRSYGIVHKVTKQGMVTIEMADGSRIERRINSIAVYIKPPANWQELYDRKVVSCQRKRRMLFGSANGKARPG